MHPIMKVMEDHYQYEIIKKIIRLIKDDVGGEIMKNKLRD